MEKQTSIKNDLIEGETYDQKELELIRTYNANLTTLDPLYASTQPLAMVLVRVFLSEPSISENGLLIPHRQLVQIPTQNGQAILQEIESPFPYSNKAIVVATPPLSSVLKPGDIVQLHSNPIKAQSQGAGKNASIHIPSAYVRPEKGDTLIPTDVTNQHYGYLLISLGEVIVKL